MSQEKYYVDADELMKNMYGTMPYVSLPGSSPLEVEISRLVNNALNSAFSIFASNVAMAIDKSKKPYSQCMLCVSRDHDIMPDDPR